jgi:RNA polymerase sigma-70 factor (ECF subfamily)
MSTPAPEQEELNRLLAEHGPRLLAMLRRRIDRRQARWLDPEGVLADVVVRAHQRWEWYRTEGRSQPYPWLYQLANDCLAEAWRREGWWTRGGRRRIPLPESPSLELVLGIVSPGSTPSAGLMRREEKQRALEALERLSESDRDLLVMRHFDDLSPAEAAAVLGVEMNTFYKRYSRALSRLRELCLPPDAGQGETR